MKTSSGFIQPSILIVISLLISALAVYVYIFRTGLGPKPQPSPIPAASTEASGSTTASPSQTATPSASAAVISTITQTPIRSGFHLASAKVESGTERRLLTLSGNGFGSNFNKVIFDDDVTKYSDYALYNWNNTKIEIFLPKEISDNQTIKVAVIKTDGTKSNTLTFNSGIWKKEANSRFDCKTPTNFRGEAVGSSDVQLYWDADPEVTRFQILQHFYTQNNESIWLYPRAITTFEGIPNGSMRIPGLTPNSANYFSLSVWCKNGYASQPTPTLTVNTPN